MPSLPIPVVWKVITAKLAYVFGRLARPLCNGLTNLSLAGSAFVRLLTGMIGKSDGFQLAANSTVLTFPGSNPKSQADTRRVGRNRTEGPELFAAKFLPQRKRRMQSSFCSVFCL
jgi:hypothetical protein